MILTGGIAGFWIFVLLGLHSANVADTQINCLNEPDVPFPPARPTAENLNAICHQGQGRPRYPAGFFQRSGASHFRRRGKAINRLESWYTLCCSGEVAQESAQVLCCTEQAWKQALFMFCVEEYSTKNLPYECCAEKGDQRWLCFDSELPNPNYSPKPGYSAPVIPSELGFTFDADACLIEE